MNGELKRLKAMHKESLYLLSERFADLLLGERLPLDIVDAQTGMIILPAGKKINKAMLRRTAAHWQFLEIDPSPVRNRVFEIVSRFEETLKTLEDEIRLHESA